MPRRSPSWICRPGRADLLSRRQSRALRVERAISSTRRPGTLRAVRVRPGPSGDARHAGAGRPRRASTTINGGVDAVVAGDGTLVYVPGGVATGHARTLVWVDRQGQETPIPAPPRSYLLSAAVTRRHARRGVRQRSGARHLALGSRPHDAHARHLDPGIDGYPVWTPDGRRLIFSSERAGARNLFWQAADGTGAVERLTESPNTQYPTAVSPDGRRLIFTEIARRRART